MSYEPVNDTSVNYLVEELSRNRKTKKIDIFEVSLNYKEINN